MSIKISLKKNISEKNIKNYVLFSNEHFKIGGLAGTSLINQSNYIDKAINSDKTNSKNFLIFNLNSNQKVIVVKLKKELNSLENEKIGAEFFNLIKKNLINYSTFLETNIEKVSNNSKFFFDEFLHGAQLKSYTFTKYKTSKKKKILKLVFPLNLKISKLIQAKDLIL